MGHRLPRDERISTHVALVARAFGAKSMIYSGQQDEGLERSVRRVVEEWGGDFEISYHPDPLKVIREYKRKGYFVLHLTMYGLPLKEHLKEVGEKVLVAVGSEKVPGAVYEEADLNASIGTQPHSEVAALAIALELLCPSVFTREFKGKKRVIPQRKGKKMEGKNG